MTEQLWARTGTTTSATLTFSRPVVAAEPEGSCCRSQSGRDVERVLQGAREDSAVHVKTEGQS